MARIFLYQPTDMSAPSASADGLGVSVYTESDTEVWGGTSSIGNELDLKITGNNLQGANGSINELTGYWDRNPYFSISGFSESVLDLTNGWQDKLFYPEFMGGNDYINATNRAGDDLLVGYRGADEIYSGEGNDIIRAGNGADIISGWKGNDDLYGGFGRNTFMSEQDGDIDYLYITSDQWAYNYVYGSAGNNPNGTKADLIEGLDSLDRIFIQGVSTSDLTFSEVNGALGIFAGGSLEAVYTGGNLSINQLNGMTAGVPV